MQVTREGLQKQLEDRDRDVLRLEGEIEANEDIIRRGEVRSWVSLGVGAGLAIHIRIGYRMGAWIRPWSGIQLTWCCIQTQRIESGGAIGGQAGMGSVVDTRCDRGQMTWCRIQGPRINSGEGQ
jgi:hypothetical protein